MPMGKYKDFDDCVKKNQDKADPEAFCGEIQKRVESILISTVLSEKPIIERNTVTLPIAKVGTAAFNAKGEKFVLSKEVLESGAESWTGGIVTINHMVKEKGKITKSWFEDPFVYAKFEDLPQEAVDAINSAAYRGVSQESMPVEVKDGQVLKLKGTGSTFVFYPFKPACGIEAGCGIPIASFNFPLYTSQEKLESNTPDGGIEITDETAKLESTISDLKTENGTLKFTIDQPHEELKLKKGQLESIANTSAEAAIEGYIKSTAEKTEREIVMNELKSFGVSDERLTSFGSLPIDALKGLAGTIKESTSKKVGAANGAGLKSTDGEIDYAALVCSSIEVE